MKFKILLVTIVSALILLSTSVYSADELKLKVMDIDITKIAQPQLIEGRTMVPVRAIYEAVGAEVSWEAETKTITGTKDDTTVIMQIGSSDISINGEISKMEAQPLIADGKNLAPARYVAESFGYVVDWDNDTKTVNIKKAVEEDTETTTLKATTEVTTEASTETTNIETTTEETTTETTTEIYVKDLSQGMVRQIKEDIKTGIGNYSLGNASSINRFTSLYRRNMYSTWESMGHSDEDTQFIELSKQFYNYIISLYSGIDNNYDKYKNRAGTELYDQYRNYKSDVSLIYAGYANSETLSQANESLEALKAKCSEFSKYIKTKFEG